MMTVTCIAFVASAAFGYTCTSNKAFTSYQLARGTLVFGDSSLLAQGQKPPEIWGTNVTFLPWDHDPVLLELRDAVRQATGSAYNVALVNWYETGADYIGLHSDNEELGDQNSIASISVGAPRLFYFQEKAPSSFLLRALDFMVGRWVLNYINRTFAKALGRGKSQTWQPRRLDLTLASGSLLHMGRNTQELYMHALPKMPNLAEFRINITFRLFHYDQTPSHGPGAVAAKFVAALLESIRVRFAIWFGL
jgi:alkylated DNA repair dioxygenase AlkB